jgi:hypothetical protein
MLLMECVIPSRLMVVNSGQIKEGSRKSCWAAPALLQARPTSEERKVPPDVAISSRSTEVSGKPHAPPIGRNLQLAAGAVEPAAH